MENNLKDFCLETNDIRDNKDYWRNCYYSSRDRLELYRAVHTVAIISFLLVAIGIVLSPVEIKVGDVCLSCWGK